MSTHRPKCRAPRRRGLFLLMLLTASTAWAATPAVSWKQITVRLAWKSAPGNLCLEASNGEVQEVENRSARQHVLQVRGAVNRTPNSPDRTLVTVHSREATFTFAPDDLKAGRLFLPELGVAILPENDGRDYATVAADQQASGGRTIYDRVRAMPEQTWRAAWAGSPAKPVAVYLPLGLDGGRQRFRLEPTGRVRFRSNDTFMKQRPGRDTLRLGLEPPTARIDLGTMIQPVSRALEEEGLPICQTVWATNGLRILQTALVTKLEGTKPKAPVPPADATAVLLMKFVFTNLTAEPVTARLPVTYAGEQRLRTLPRDKQGFLWLGGNVRAQVTVTNSPTASRQSLTWTWTLAPGEAQSAVVKIPWAPLTETAEHEALAQLDFDAEHEAVAGYWRRRLDEGARLITPEPMLNEFYRAHAVHLLMNCEREPGSSRRFARSGSFQAGVRGRDACLMVLELERRGYHREAQECLETWLRYQGTTGFPGLTSPRGGLLYGAGGYEADGDARDHGWVLWMLAEHYRFTRDEGWLRRALPAIAAGAEWVRSCALPPGAANSPGGRSQPIERAGEKAAGEIDLVSGAYNWRGLDAAAWALEQVRHPQAAQVRHQADVCRTNLLLLIREAAQRSPVVRLRDGTAVPGFVFPSTRRNPSGGSSYELADAPTHLLIAHAVDPRSPEGTWILKNSEDNGHLWTSDGRGMREFDRYWFDRGGLAWTAGRLGQVEPYLCRDEIRAALRAVFNAQAAAYIPDARLNAGQAGVPGKGADSDCYRTAEEANCSSWLSELFVREDSGRLLLGQGVSRPWLTPGRTCGLENAATGFGHVSVVYLSGENTITARVQGANRHPPEEIRVRFREPAGRPLAAVQVNGKRWKTFDGEWVTLPGDIGEAEIVAQY